MDKEIREYRETHKKCKWCKFFKTTVIDFLNISSIKECKMKDKIIYNENMPRFCKYYKVNEEEE